MTKRFCMVTTFYPPYNYGGDGIFVHRLADELARRGHSVDVIHCADAYRLGGGPEPTTSAPNLPGVTVHRLESRIGAMSPLLTQQTGYPMLKSRKIREILGRGFDVIHYHNISLIGGPGVLAYGDAVKLYTMHEYWLVCPTHVLFRYDREPCEKRTCLRCTLSYRRPPQLWRYFGTLGRKARHVDAFIAPSEFSRRAHARLGLPIVRLPNFIPVADATPPSVKTSGVNDGSEGVMAAIGDGPFFLFVGRLERLKGLQTVIPSFAAYPRAKLVIAGDGEFAGELKRLAGGSGQIVFLGRVTPAALRPIFERARALIVPSICYESFSLVTVEAFRERTPVIARDLGGTPELIAASGGGFTFKDPTELVSHLDRLVDEPELRGRLGQAGHDAFLRHWTADAHLERYFALIERIQAGEPIIENAEHDPAENGVAG